jgi:hypothetical protein
MKIPEIKLDTSIEVAELIIVDILRKILRMFFGRPGKKP